MLIRVIWFAVFIAQGVLFTEAILIKEWFEALFYAGNMMVMISFTLQIIAYLTLKRLPLIDLYDKERFKAMMQFDKRYLLFYIILVFIFYVILPISSGIIDITAGFDLLWKPLFKWLSSLMMLALGILGICEMNKRNKDVVT